jgi:hypothetical protein
MFQWFQRLQWFQWCEWCERCAVGVVFVEFLLMHGLKSFGDVCGAMKTVVARFKDLVREIRNWA